MSSDTRSGGKWPQHKRLGPLFLGKWTPSGDKIVRLGPLFWSRGGLLWTRTNGPTTVLIRPRGARR